MLARTEENLKDEEKSLFDWCKEGNVEKIRELLNPDNINHQDEDVRSKAFFVYVYGLCVCVYVRTCMCV